jgi:hypothetical protein
MPGMTFFRTITTRGIEFSQSLCRMTFQGSSGLALLPVWLCLSFLIFVAAIVEDILASRPARRITRKD